MFFENKTIEQLIEIIGNLLEVNKNLVKQQCCQTVGCGNNQGTINIKQCFCSGEM